MVESALNLLSTKGIIDLDEDKKAAMVSNLMVVLCVTGNQPVLNYRDIKPIKNGGKKVLLLCV